MFLGFLFYISLRDYSALQYVCMFFVSVDLGWQLYFHALF